MIFTSQAKEIVIGFLPILIPFWFVVILVIFFINRSLNKGNKKPWIKRLILASIVGLSWVISNIIVSFAGISGSISQATIESFNSLAFPLNSIEILLGGFDNDYLLYYFLAGVFWTLVFFLIKEAVLEVLRKKVKR